MLKSRVPHLVRVRTTARLHMGFLDMHGGLGRRFGSIGLSLDKPALVLSAHRSDKFEAVGPGAERALSCARRFAERAGISGGACLNLEESIPEHAGLGSGTQMALAVGMMLTKLYGLPLSVDDVAALTERGARSGIGIGTFTQGGLLVDGGRGKNTIVPPVLARLEFPAEWRVLLIFDRQETGVHGGEELTAFRTLPEFPETTAAELCRRVLMQALPAVAERDLTAFGEAIHHIQCRIGDYFSTAQGGGRYTSTTVGDVLAWLQQQGVGCVGQSSWGPTGFAVMENDAVAQDVLVRLRQAFLGHEHLSFVLCGARNEGSEMQAQYADIARAAS